MKNKRTLSLLLCAALVLGCFAQSVCAVDLSNLEPVESEINSTPALIRGVAARFAQMGCTVKGFDAYCESTVLPGSGLSRKLNLAGIKKNLYAVKCVLDAVKECKRTFREFKPDAVIGTGGYASYPVNNQVQSA